MSLLGNRSGAAALEFGLVAPLFLLIVCATLDTVRWGQGAAVMRDLAAQSARCIAVSPSKCGSAAAVRKRHGGKARLDFEPSACGVVVTARGGHESPLAPGGGKPARACAG